MISFTVLSLIYFSLIILILIALLREKICGENTSLSATVIVCVDHDEVNLRGLLEALKNLDYPDTLLEIFLVAEISDPGIGKIIESQKKEDSRIRPVYIHEREEGLSGKKNAITQAVGIANGEIILLTEVRCRPGPNWVKRMVACFDEDTGMVMGFASIDTGTGLVQRFLEFDQIARVTVQTAGAYWDIPPYSTARNLAFRRRIFFEVNGYESSGQIATGDDFFLTRDIWLKTKRPFRQAMHPESYVMTQKGSSPWSYLKKQLKRSGKIYHLTPFYKGIGVFILLYFCSIPVAIISLPPQLWAGSLIIKTLLEWLGIIFAIKRFGYKHMALWYPLFAPVYPLYVIVSSFVKGEKMDKNNQ